MTKISTLGLLTLMWVYNKPFYKKKKDKKCIKNSKNVSGDELVKIKTPFQPLNVSSMSDQPVIIFQSAATFYQTAFSTMTFYLLHTNYMFTVQLS
jgi:hypothetical protein